MRGCDSGCYVCYIVWFNHKKYHKLNCEFQLDPSSCAGSLPAQTLNPAGAATGEIQNCVNFYMMKPWKHKQWSPTVSSIALSRVNVCLILLGIAVTKTVFLLCQSDSIWNSWNSFSPVTSMHTAGMENNKIVRRQFQKLVSDVWPSSGHSSSGCQCTSGIPGGKKIRFQELFTAKKLQVFFFRSYESGK